jgi:hypothetical protein
VAVRAGVCVEAGVEAGARGGSAGRTAVGDAAVVAARTVSDPFAAASPAKIVRLRTRPVAITGSGALGSVIKGCASINHNAAAAAEAAPPISNPAQTRRIERLHKRPSPFIGLYHPANLWPIRFPLTCGGGCSGHSQSRS